MNERDARSIGQTDGERFFRLRMDFQKDLTNEYLLESARNRAQYTYRARSQKTIDLYVQGYRDAINAYEADQVREAQHAAERAAIPHNPSSRFCTCVARKEGE